MVVADVSEFLPLICLPSSPSSPLPSLSVCYPPPTRPPARLLLQTQLRGRLNALETSTLPRRCDRGPRRPRLAHLPIYVSFLLCLPFLLFLKTTQHSSSSSSAPLRKHKLYFFSWHFLDETFRFFPKLLHCFFISKRLVRAGNESVTCHSAAILIISVMEF